jgi:hypothetical protein
VFALYPRTTEVPNEEARALGKMRILDETGDTTIEWTVDDDEALRRAETLFRQQMNARQMAFSRPAQGTVEDADRIFAFDPNAEEIIWVRPIQGG